MSEQLRAAIERAFIDLYYAAAELKLGEPGQGAAPAAAHVKQAIRALLSGLRSSRAGEDGAPPAGSIPN